MRKPLPVNNTIGGVQKFKEGRISMAKNKDNKAKNNKKSKSGKGDALKGIDVIDNVGAVSATDMTGAMPFNAGKNAAGNIDDVVHYTPKAKGKAK